MIARYTKLAVALHWVTATLVIINVALAWIWPVVADDQFRPLINAHKSIGVTVLGLAIMRLLWRLTHRPPALPRSHQPWERTLSSVVHAALYVVMFVMPLSGWAMESAKKTSAAKPLQWFGLFDWPRFPTFSSLDQATLDGLRSIAGNAHGLAALALYALVFFHVAGALKHQFLDRQPSLKRMWF